MGNQPIRSNNQASGKRFQSQASTNLRKNDRIRVPEVRVIGPNGDQIGVMPTKQALTLAKQVGLDLVEISANAKPPVCRIIDFGKFMYEQSKKTKDNKTAVTKLKEIKFRVNIDTHDYMTKIRRAEGFLNKGNKLKITLMLRGREMEHQELAMEIVNRAVKDLDGVGTADSPSRLAGRNISATLSPLAVNKRKPRHIIEGQADDEEDEEDEEEEDDKE